VAQFDLIIIGGGPAGLTAGLYAARAGMNAVLLEQKGTGGELNNTDLIEDWPGEESITGFELGEKMRKHAEKFGLKIEIEGALEVWSEGDRKMVRLADGTTHSAYAVIVSVGGEPIKLNVPGEQEFAGKGVSYCAVCDGAFFKGVDLAVIGGGDSAFQEGLFLTRFAKKLYVVHRRNEFRAQAILRDRLLGMEKVEPVTPASVKRIGGNGQVQWIEIEREGRTERLPVEGVFIFVGFKPVGRFLFKKEHIEHEPQTGYLITDQYMRTNIPGVYAVGDTRAQLAKQITTAVGDATTAVLHAERYIEGLKHAERALPETPRGDIPAMVERLEPVRVMTGQTIVREGDSADSFFIVVRGRVGVYQSEDGEERQINTLGPGEFFGEIGLLGGVPRIATVRALEPSELLRLDRASFENLVSKSSATREQLDEVARERLAASSRR
jgi:thioredoxin reductase (NADPH)